MQGTQEKCAEYLISTVTSARKERKLISIVPYKLYATTPNPAARSPHAYSEIRDTHQI